MGQLVYAPRSSFEIDDTLLAHLRIVVMNKLRRGEAFMMQLPHPTRGQASVWIAPSSALLFVFFSNRAQRIDADVIQQMMQEASEPNGLTLYDVD